MLQIPDEIKELLHRDSCQKNIRIHFPNGERSDICNNLIVKDSVSFTESLCSQNTLKFGLCESPVFECEVVGVGNIKGATIEVNCEIYCDSSVTGAIWQNDLMAYVYQIPYGTFIVQEAKRQADMNHRKISAYGFVYNSLLYDVNQNTALSLFELSEIQNTSGSSDVGLETLIYETYPYLLNEEDYTYTKTYINDLLSFGMPKTWTFKIGNDFYTLQLNFGYGGLSKNTNQILLLDFDYLPTKSDEEILNYLNQIISQLNTDYPNAKDTSGNPFDFKEEIMAYGLENMRPVFTYRRSDYTTSSTINYKLFTLNGGKWVIFNNANTHGFNLQKGGYKFSVYHGGITTNIGSTFYYFTDDAYYCRIPRSEVVQTSYTLTRTPDKYTDKGFYGGTVTCSGYSYREQVEKIDMLKLMKSYAEVNGFFWNVLRDVSKKLYLKQQFGLTPSQTLYPGSSLYPEGVTGGKLLPNDYQSCWYEDDYTKPFGAIVCNYKNTNNEDCSYTLYLSGFDSDTDTNTYQTYYITDNYIINNSTWTEAQIEDICETIAANIEGVTYMPVEFVGRGLPYVEAGDTFEILTASNDSITTIVLNRTVSGEQVLTDSYKSVS